ncbi:NAD(P)/FAD-dependent oxidoreductase [Maritimibacter fusiformis]|uniref:FAD-binding oxidoreductase n=1 Tax=Maritimibacter fusiformis TaxID=2603819 RepID=A0A5D0RR75_9RHOB|nr:FAD-binding oxidoreductase [Maritimibacter fusiformis]TYB83178.1 FAD-binding oxidoreductase [Maritimibacter fusiformis]
MQDMTEPIFDIAVIGGGMAGASVAAELAPHARVVLIERESQPGYHTTGRSAAIAVPTYGPAPIRALTRASDAFFHNPPAGFSDHPLFSPRHIVMVAREDQIAELDALVEEVGDRASLQRLDAAELKAACPLLRDGYGAAGLLDTTGNDIDVASLHQGYLRGLKAAGGEVRTRTEVAGLMRDGDSWRVETSTGPIHAHIVVNAAGAWAGVVGAMAGAEDIGLIPKRRTATVIAAPDGTEVHALPMTIDIDEQFYLKPDAGRLLISPADETPDVPGDVQPEELDVAICVDRIETAFEIQVRRIENKWAGLRSFVADKSPVAGFSDRTPGFYWLAGQGGYGIQSAPALARFAAAQVLGRDVPADILDQGLEVSDLAPARLATA